MNLPLPMGEDVSIADCKDAFMSLRAKRGNLFLLLSEKVAAKLTKMVKTKYELLIYYFVLENGKGEKLCF